MENYISKKICFLKKCFFEKKWIFQKCFLKKLPFRLKNSFSKKCTFFMKKTYFLKNTLFFKKNVFWCAYFQTDVLFWEKQIRPCWCCRHKCPLSGVRCADSFGIFTLKFSKLSTHSFLRMPSTPMDNSQHLTWSCLHRTQCSTYVARSPCRAAEVSAEWPHGHRARA